MKSKKRTVPKNRKVSVIAASSRRAFLKHSAAFMALTATYSVISLTQLACNDGNSTTENGPYNGNYNGGYFNGDYFDGDYFDDDYFFYY